MNLMNGKNKTHMKSQTEKILHHLKSGKSLTPISALNKFGSFRLASRISDLKRDGHKIISIRTKKQGKTFSTYKLVA